MIPRLLLMLPFLLAYGCASLRDPSPLRTRNAHPLQLTAYQPLPRAAWAVGAGKGRVSLGAQWANTWVLARPSTAPTQLDVETVRGDLDVTTGLLPGVDLEIGVSVLHASGGALDRFIERFHRLTGGKDQDRSDEPRNQFEVRVDRDTDGGRRSVYRLEPHGAHFGDIPVTINWMPFDRDAAWGLGFRAGFEIPSGDEDDGIGSGDFDVGAGIVTDLHLDRVALFAWGSHAHIARTRAMRRASLSDPQQWLVGAAVELGLTDWWSLIAQTQWETSVGSDLEDRHINKDHILLWLGVRSSETSFGRIELSAGEDLARRISPDIIFDVRWSVRW